MVWGYGGRMRSISYARHRFPQIVIQHAVWLYVRFGLSYRDGLVTFAALRRAGERRSGGHDPT